MNHRQKLLQDHKDVSKFHFDYVKSRNFQIASEAALLQMFSEAQGTNDPNIAMREQNMIAGACRFLKIFSTIADPIEVPKPVLQTLPANLDHK